MSFPRIAELLSDLRLMAIADKVQNLAFDGDPAGGRVLVTTQVACQRAFAEQDAAVRDRLTITGDLSAAQFVFEDVRASSRLQESASASPSPLPKSGRRGEVGGRRASGLM